MIATPWQDKNKLIDSMFDPEGFDKTISMIYFDIPALHGFDTPGCRFFDLLNKSDDIELFSKRSV